MWSILCFYVKTVQYNIYGIHLFIYHQLNAPVLWINIRIYLLRAVILSFPNSSASLRLTFDLFVSLFVIWRDVNLATPGEHPRW